MWTPLLVSVLSIAQAAGEGTPQAPRERLDAALEGAAKEADFDAAALILSTSLSDESLLRSAYAMSSGLDQRSIYILFGGNWGSRAEVAWKERVRRRRILAESISAKPELVRPALRADRYAAYLIELHPPGAATINSFPFFSYSSYADDLAERFVETLRREAAHPANAIYDGRRLLVPAEEVEMNLLETWQLLCGACGRLDLIDGATTKNWRGRFPILDAWFRENRPFMLWDEDKSCLYLDEESKAAGCPTPRESRAIPGLRPPWCPEGEPGVRGMP